MDRTTAVYQTAAALAELCSRLHRAIEAEQAHYRDDPYDSLAHVLRDFRIATYQFLIEAIWATRAACLAEEPPAVPHR